MPPSGIRIIGIDPGLQKTGWGIVDVSGASLRYVASGLIKPPLKADMAVRLCTLSEELNALLTRYDPKCAAIEETFVNQNPTSSLKLGMARGAAMLTLAMKGLVVGEYAPNTIKKSLVGQGHAAKTQIGMMVKTLLPSCSAGLSEDEADALAVAITHAHYNNFS